MFLNPGIDFITRMMSRLSSPQNLLISLSMLSKQNFIHRNELENEIENAYFSFNHINARLRLAFSGHRIMKQM